MAHNSGAAATVGGVNVTRMLEQLRSVERTLAAIDLALQQVGWVGSLLLAHNRAQNAYEWRKRGVGRFATHVGARVPSDLLATMRRTTRAKVEAVENLLEARLSGRTLLRLVGAVVVEGPSWAENVVTVTWVHPQKAGYTWVCPLDAGMMGQAFEVVGIRGLPAWRDVVRPYAGRLRGPTPIVDALDGWLSGAHAIETRLSEASQRLRDCRLRLYYSAPEDRWLFRWVSRRRSSSAPLVMVSACLPKLAERHRPTVLLAADLMEVRRRCRRAARVLEGLTDLGSQWLMGHWCVRGYATGASDAALWTYIAARGRVLRRG